MTFNGSIAPPGIRSERINWLNWIGSSVLFISWLYLNRTTLHWFAQLPQRLSKFNLIFFLGVILILLIQGVIQNRRILTSLEPHVRRWPFVLMLGAAIASILFRWYLDLESLSGAFFLVGTYGFAGLFLQPKHWKQGLPLMGAIALIVLTALGPFSRSMIAEIVKFILQPFHIHSLSSENILVLDTGIAFIDLPCSGRKSLWTGSLFLIAATLIERRQMGLRWFALFFTNLGLLLTANILRILTLVVLTYVMNQGALAKIVHTPFGLLSFITVCLISWGLLRFIPQNQSPQIVKDLTSQGSTASHTVRNLVLACSLVLGLTLIPTPAKAVTPPDIFDTLPWQPTMTTETIDLTPAEQQFFATYPGVVTEKQSFGVDGLTGSMMFVISPTWQAHHAPELCLSGSGHRVNHMEKRALTAEVSGRWLSLDDGAHNAVYWFQSSQRTTDSYLDRLWSEITRQDSQWTMVSILFDHPVESQDVQPMLEQVHDAIATVMT